jgi:hypothetical protein
MNNYLNHREYTKEYYMLATLDEIKKYSKEFELDLSVLSDRIRKMMEGRQT